MTTDPLSLAALLVRDSLETLMSRHEPIAKSRGREGQESAMVLTLSASLLEHLDAEAKRIRAEKS